MTKVVIAALALAGMLVITSGAAAATHRPASKAKIARLSKEVRHLRAQLNAATAARKAATASLAAANGTVAADATLNSSLRSQVAGLQSELAEVSSALSATQVKEAALQAKLDAIPAPITVAELQVEHEVAWAGSTGMPQGELTALATLDYVVGHVSVGEYGWLEVNHLPLPVGVEAVLGQQAGICGETSLAFAEIMQALGYQTRRVAFYWHLANGAPDAHTAVEIYYGGGWHYFDPTYDQYWSDPATGNVLSITEARDATLGGVRHKNDFTFTNVVEDPWFAGDDTAFETDPATTVVLGGAPFIG
jgi:hypothetical protein